MIPTFSIRFLFAATFFVAICAHYWHLAIGYSEPMVRQFTPSLLEESRSESSVLVIVYTPYYEGIEDFILRDESIRKCCHAGELVVLREVYSREPDFHRYFSPKYHHHKEAIFVFYDDEVSRWSWPSSMTEAILRNLKSRLGV